MPGASRDPVDSAGPGAARGAVLAWLAAVAACGCGAFGPPWAPAGHAPAGPRATFPAGWTDLAAPAAPGDAGLDLAGPEARLALVGTFVAPPGAAADFVGSGLGEGLAFAYRAQSGGDPEGDIYLEWGLERSAHEEAGSGAAAEYWRATGGVRWSNPWGRRAELFLCLGGGYHLIRASGGQELECGAVYGGGGVEVLLGRAWSALFTARLNYLWADDPGYAAVLAAGVGLRL